MTSEQEVEKKLGMSLDELIASQAKKKAAGKPKATGGGGRVKKGGAQKVQTKGGGRVLVVPRPKHVPKPSGGGSGGGRAGLALKGTRGGGVQKGGSAPKFAYGGSGGGGGGGGHMGGHAGRQATSRNVKVTIGNKLSGRPASHLPTSGVLAKPFLGAAGGARNGGGRAPMMVEGGGLPGPGGSLASRFDALSGGGPAAVARPTGAPRRNAHGVLIP
ncbi:hypothetical protein ABPG75_003399 [Micractinium tetrahymenae]